jgi:Flp pilus assembly protein TadD
LAKALLYAGVREGKSAEDRKRVLDALASLERIDPQHPYIEMFRTNVRIFWDDTHSLAPDVATLTRLLQRDDLTPALRAEILLSRVNFTIDRDSTGALADLREAMHLVPANSECFAYLSKLARLQGKAHEAVERAEQAIALSPETWWNHQQLASALTTLGRYDEAAMSYRWLYEKFHGQSSWRVYGQNRCLLLARVLALGGHHAEAKKMEEEALAFPVTADGLYLIAGYLAVTGNRAGALRDLRRALQLEFKDSRIANDPDFVSLRGDPTFEAMVDEVKKRGATK